MYSVPPSGDDDPNNDDHDDGKQTQQIPVQVNESPQLQEYQLAWDRERQEFRTCVRYGFSDLIAFALIVFNELVDSEPKTYAEAMSGKHAKE